MGIEEGRLGLRGHVICFDSIGGDNARLLDIQNDDGAPNTGSVRSGLNNSASVTAAPYVDNEIYNTCFRM